MATGDEQPTVRDGLAAIRLLAETEGAAAQQRGVEEHISAMIMLVETVRDHVSDDTYAAIGRDLAANPLLRPIAAGRSQ